MRSRPLVAPIFAAAYLCVAQFVDGDETTSKERLLREYPQSIQALQTAYPNARGTLVVKEKSESRGNEERVKSSKSRMEFSIAGQWAKSQLFDEGFGTDPAIEFERINCVGPRGSFRLLRHAEGTTPEVKEIEAAGSKRVRESIDRTIGQYIKAASGSIEEVAGRVLAHRESVVGVRELLLDGKKLISADYQWQFKSRSSSSPITQVMTLLLSPEEGWALREYSFGPSEAPKTHWGRIEYDSPQRGTPRPKRITTVLTSRTKQGASKITTTSFEFERLDLEASPESEFTLEAFGLGKIESPPVKPTTKSNGGYWFFGLAAIAFVAAIGLKILASRRPRGDATPLTGGA